MNTKYDTPLKKLISKLGKRTAIIDVIDPDYVELPLMWCCACLGQEANDSLQAAPSVKTLAKMQRSRMVFFEMGSFFAGLLTSTDWRCRVVNWLPKISRKYRSNSVQKGIFI